MAGVMDAQHREPCMTCMSECGALHLESEVVPPHKVLQTARPGDKCMFCDGPAVLHVGTS